MLSADFIIVVSHIKIRPAVHLRWPVGLKLIRPEQQKHNFLHYFSKKIKISTLQGTINFQSYKR